MAKNWKQLAVTVASLALIVGGAYVAFAPQLLAQSLRQSGERQNASALQQASQRSGPAAFSAPEVAALELPRLNVHLSVQPGAYNPATARWTLDDQHAFFAGQTATPLFYGHNIQPVFQPLNGVAKDEVLYMYDKNGRKFLFRFVFDQIVSADDDSVLTTKLETTVLLMTCDGLQSQDRRVLYFALVGEVQP